MAIKESTDSNDLFSRLVNWLSDLDKEESSIDETNGGQDFFSRFMNHISQ